MRKFKHGPRGRLLFAPTSQRPFHSTQSQSPHCAPPSCSVGTTGGPEARGHSLPQPMAPRPGHTPLLCPGPRPARRSVTSSSRAGKDTASWQVAPQHIPAGAGPGIPSALPQAGQGQRQVESPRRWAPDDHTLLPRAHNPEATEPHSTYRGLGCCPRLPPSSPASPGVHRKPDPQDCDPHKRSEAHCRPPSPPQKRGPASSASIHFLEATSPPSSRARVGGWPVTSASQSPPRLF